jgi:hypothetical protein
MRKRGVKAADSETLAHPCDLEQHVPCLCTRPEDISGCTEVDVMQQISLIILDVALLIRAPVKWCFDASAL